VRRGIRRTRQFGRDVIAICSYIRERNADAAARVFDAIENTSETISELPGIGTIWHSPYPGLDGMRVVTVAPYRNYLIFFRLVEDTVELYRVVHGARELEPIVEQIQLDFE